MIETLPIKRPVVASEPKPASVAGGAAVVLLLGAGVFLWLSEARAAGQDAGSSLPPLQVTTTPTPAPMTGTEPDSASAAEEGGPFLIPNSSAVTLVATQPDAQPSTQPPGYYGAIAAPARPTQADSQRERLRAPALVVDLAQADPRGSAPARSDGGQPAVAGPVPAPAPGGDATLSDTERFSARVGGEESKAARAQRMTSLDRLVPQGAIIGAVMETALNSDLPGYARAVVQRDVYSFDGSAVLIPAGSRVIGQYKSGIAQGASRVFVLWTRLIRPDGVSIELASPAVDNLGRGGIGGKINRHFFQRFGGAILTSVLTGAVGALSGGSTIIVSGAGQASSLAGQAFQSNEIPPTITTRQGAPVRIFVARDLDFSQVGPA